MCTISKHIDIKKDYVYQTRSPYVGIDVKEQVQLPNMKSVNCNKNIIGICKKINMTAKQGIPKDHICEITDMAYKCNIFLTVNLTFHGCYTYMCTVSIVIGINTENKIYLPNKEYTTVHS